MPGTCCIVKNRNSLYLEGSRSGLVISYLACRLFIFRGFVGGNNDYPDHPAGNLTKHVDADFGPVGAMVGARRNFVANPENLGIEYLPICWAEEMMLKRWNKGLAQTRSSSSLSNANQHKGSEILHAPRSIMTGIPRVPRFVWLSIGCWRQSDPHILQASISTSSRSLASPPSPRRPTALPTR